jgi:hypothetical protein
MELYLILAYIIRKELETELIRLIGAYRMFSSFFSYIPYLFKNVEPKTSDHQLLFVMGVIGAGTYIGGQLSEIRKISKIIFYI